MGNTVSADVETNDVWWSQAEQSHTTEPTENTLSMSSSTTMQEEITETSNSLENSEPICVTAVENVLLEDISVGVNEDERSANRKSNDDKLELFRSELANKHLARRQAIAERSKEILFLREELVKQKKENEELREMLNVKRLMESDVTNVEQIEILGVSANDTSWNTEMDRLKTENEELKQSVISYQNNLTRHEKVLQQNHDLRLNIAEIQNELQTVNSQVISFEKERHDYQTHVSAMKEVVKVSKQMLEIRENQLEELRTKVTEIESNLAEQENSMLSTNLRNEYEKQLRNMRALRTLYEQRQAATKAERDSMAAKLDEASKGLEYEKSKTKELQERVEEAEKDISDKYDNVQSLQSQLGFVQAECRGLQAEMLVINQLFSQILHGFNNGQVDMDKLINLLEENHDLLTDIVINEESMEHLSALPKTLLDLVNQVREKDVDKSCPTVELEDLEQCANSDMPPENSQMESQPIEQQTGNQMCSAAEIVHNLPKVWRVLAELLSQQAGQQQVVINDDGMDPCYKSIETPKGPKTVLSVSQTFIRLKDLILEKKSLEKEMTRLKQLNGHLEVRLQDQEKRLETVSTELSKTWHVVGRMQKQHQQLHTHEKILRYELAQKRKLLTELKQELEYCREKWEQAREKNSNTEEQWKKLRTEFASRKATIVDELNNSGESGYSDERECSSDEDSSYNPNKKINKPVISVVKATSDTEDNDENSRGSDAEDILEKAFSKACSVKMLQKSQIAFSEVCSVNQESPNEETSNSQDEFKPDTNCLHEIEQERIILNTNELSPTCDNEITEDENTLECVSNEEMSHSNTTIKTDNEVQIENDTSTQEECDTSTQEINEESREIIASQINVPITDVANVIDEAIASTSQSQSDTALRSSEEMLSKREARLQKLEEQCKQLVKKVTNTTNRGVEICTRLETLHEQYSSNADQSQNPQNDPDSDE